MLKLHRKEGRKALKSYYLQEMKKMGKLNLIQSHWTGQVGAYTGQRYKGRSVIKSNEHKKRHPNTAQTKSVRAFECLNRFASGCVGKLWKYTGLNDKKMLKHNALAADWKKIIENKNFSPENLNQIYAQSALDIQTEINISLNNENVVVNWTIPEYDSTLYKLYGTIIDNKGNVLFFNEMPTGQIVSKVITSNCNLGDWIYCPCFLVELPTSTEKAVIEVILGEKEVYTDAIESVFSVNVTRNNAVLTANVTTEQPLNFVYQWYKDGVAISGATSNTYTFSEMGTFKVEVTSNTEGYSTKTEEGEITYEWGPLTGYINTINQEDMSGRVNKTWSVFVNNTEATSVRVVSSTAALSASLPRPWQGRTSSGILRQQVWSTTGSLPATTLGFEAKDDLGITLSASVYIAASFTGNLPY